MYKEYEHNVSSKLNKSHLISCVADVVESDDPNLRFLSSQGMNKDNCCALSTL
jgi:hypothetical protein